MLLSEVFDMRHIKLNLESETRDGAFEELAETIIIQHPELDLEEILEAVALRENQMSTAVLPGVAVPHGYCHSFNGVVGAIGISRAGIPYGSSDQAPVHSIFMVLMGEASRENHLGILSRLLILFNSQEFPGIQTAESPREIYDILSRF
jgi:mannitol/fructose-specific phosphotransferase system IIA component (Ntr-type)